PGLLRASAVMAGGICGTGETCGVVLGGLLAIGDALGNDDFRDFETYKEVIASARAFVDRLLERYGSTRCHDIQEAMLGWRHGVRRAVCRGRALRGGDHPRSRGLLAGRRRRCLGASPGRQSVPRKRRRPPAFGWPPGFVPATGDPSAR
ncbi:MAG: C_GCAxxG_C_C family protein, partial [Candidatus Bipolaricaulota bacterium]